MGVEARLDDYAQPPAPGSLVTSPAIGTSLRALLVAATVLVGPAALAQDVLDELPEVELKRIPPVYSYDVGLQLGVADITYWRDEVPPWATLGFFASWGWHPRGNDRIGPGFAAMIEGPLPLHYSVSFEPTFRWDRIMGKLQVGAAIGPAFMLHSKSTQLGPEMAFTPAPMIAGRIGWSEGWTRIGRRLFVVAEPKLRLVAGDLNYGVTVQIGAGEGY